MLFFGIYWIIIYVVFVLHFIKMFYYLDIWTQDILDVSEYKKSIRIPFPRKTQTLNLGLETCSHFDGKMPLNGRRSKAWYHQNFGSRHHSEKRSIVKHCRWRSSVKWALALGGAALRETGENLHAKEKPLWGWRRA